MTKERIEEMRKAVLPFVKKKLVEINYEGLGKGDAKEFEKDFNELLNLASKALEQDNCTLDDAREDFVFDVYNILDFLPTNNEANRIIDVFDRVTEYIEQEPCDDCVSRQAVLKIVNGGGGSHELYGVFERLTREVKALPPVTPTRTETVTEFADRCVECGNEYGRRIKELEKSMENLQKIEQIIKKHDNDSMPEDFFYIDKIREVLEE